MLVGLLCRHEGQQHEKGAGWMIFIRIGHPAPVVSQADLINGQVRAGV